MTLCCITGEISQYEHASLLPLGYFAKVDSPELRYILITVVVV